jgi:polyisoprenoid-binding protein YceI
MKNYFYPFITVFVLVLSASFSFQSSNYQIKDGYSVQFKSKDPSGSFKMNGTIHFDENDLQKSKFDLLFPIESISTGNGMKNKKAQTAEWFDAKKYPEIKFTSSKIEKSGNDYMVSGKLMIKGVSKETKVPVKLTSKGNELVFSGAFDVNRMDFKVGKKSAVVPDIMHISYSIPTTKN